MTFDTLFVNIRLLVLLVAAVAVIGDRPYFIPGIGCGVTRQVRKEEENEASI
jgi:hypothetical protein